MASLTIKNIPDDLYDHLKKTASLHHRSINSELIYCLEKVLRPGRLSAQEIKDNARVVRDRVKTAMISADDITEAKNAGRK